MRGKPKYAVSDIVSFKLEDTIKTGEVYIVDKNGTFFDNSDASYDIYVEEDNCLYKHINEKAIIK